MNSTHNLSSQLLKRCALAAKLALVAGLFAPLLAQTASAQTNNYYGTSGALSGNVWNTNPAGPTYTNALVSTGGAIINFGNPATQAGGANSITVAGINATANFSITGSPSGTIANLSNGIIPINVANGVTLDFGSQSFTASGTAGYTFNGNSTGVLALAGNTYGGGFTLTSGTVILRGANALGSNTTTGVLNINGGTIAANATRDLSNKFSNIAVGGNFTLGGTTGLALSTANLTFNNTVSLGAVQRTINLGGSGTYTLSGVISGTSPDNALALTSSLAHANSGTLSLAGAASNTYSGATEVNTGWLRLAKTSGAVAIPGGLNITGGSVLFLPGEEQNQIADSANVVMSGQALLNATTTFDVGTVAIQETISSLSMTGASGFVTGASTTGWTITNAMSITGGAGARFAASSGGLTKVGSLSLTNMTASAGDPIDPLLVADAPNTFTIYGNDATTKTTFIVGSGGLLLNGSILNMRRGTTEGLALGSRLVLDGNVTTAGSSASQIKLNNISDNGKGALSVELSSTSGDVVRTITTAGGGADLSIGIPITNGAATNAGIIKQGPGTLTLTAVNTYTGTTTVNEGSLIVTAPGRLANNGITKVLLSAPDDSLAGNPSLTRPIAAGLNTYAGFGSAVTATSLDPVLVPAQSLQTTAEILMSGTNAAANSMTMQWRTRTAAEAAGSNPNAVLSDVLSLTDMGSDIFVLQMSYSDAALTKLGLTESAIASSGMLRLGWKNGSTWTTAVEGNSGGTPLFAGMTPWLSYYNTLSSVDNGSDLASFLGSYGVDPANNVVWAVLNHNSEFAVIPEPSTLLFGGITLLGLSRFALRRRRFAD